MTGGLVGRGALLAAAMTSVDAAMAGSGGLLLLSGEPGIGKTALLGELASAARGAGARVLRGTCWDGGVPAYWPWTPVLRALKADGAELGEAGRLVRSDPGESLPGSGEAAADARFRLFDAVATGLVGLTESGPVIVVLDDLQWADEPSLRLLDFVVRQLSTCRLLVLGAYRDDEASPMVRALSEIGRLLPVGGVGRADVPALMAAVAGPAAVDAPGGLLAERIWRRSGGNPFLVGELTRLLLSRGGWLDPERAADVPIPDGVRDTLDRRMARLSQPCTSVLTVAALVGPIVRSDVVDAVLGRAGSTSEALAEAVNARVLRIDPEGRPMFAHDLFREALVAGLPAARRRELHLTLGRILEQRRGVGAYVSAAELAAHFLAAVEPEVADEAVRYATAAARQATARLGHEEACRHYGAALDALDLLDDAGGVRRIALMLELAAAQDRCGEAEAARSGFRQAADLARRAADPIGLASAAIGLHGLGSRSGSTRSEAIDLLTGAASALAAVEPGEDAAGQSGTALRSHVLACLSRAVRHGTYGSPPEAARVAAEEAVALARTVGEQAGLAVALLALHDATWEPGNARSRLHVLTGMHEAAEQAGDRDLLALAHQLRAAALLELGEPAAQRELAVYAVRAEELGHARGRWFALTRRATLAVLAGQVDEAVDLAARGLKLGRAIGQVDAAGAFGTLNASLGLLGHPPAGLDPATLEADPLQPMIPMLHAWVLVASGRGDAARSVFAGFASEVVPDKHDLEMPAIFAAVSAAVGSSRQREDAYQRLLPYAGQHVVVGGCASYSGAVDHHLGLLAAALGRPGDAAAHLRAAIGMYERLGVEAWAARARTALADIEGGPANTFRRDGEVWTLVFGGVPAHLPDVKGLHDLAILLAVPGRPVHVFTLLGRAEPATGADPVLDERALRAYRARLAELDAQLDAATTPEGRDRAAAERVALVKELTAAAGLGGRSRRLGDETERARKTITSRIRDALRRIDREHPTLGAHLHASVNTGTSCVYTPPNPTSWCLTPGAGHRADQPLPQGRA